MLLFSYNSFSVSESSIKLISGRRDTLYIVGLEKGAVIHNEQFVLVRWFAS